MSTSKDGQSGLNIYAEDIATEIWVSDGRFHTVAHGLGHIEVPLGPGIYRVRAAAGSQKWESFVALQPEQTSFIQVPRLQFKSPMPLPDTALTNEYQEFAASNESHKEHVKAGSGSAIFVFVRHYTPQNGTMPSNPQNPALGLTLWDEGNNLIADLSAKSAVDPGDSNTDTWAACNIAVNPGFYQLRLELPMNTVLEQPIIASPGWQTQIFTLQQSYGSETSDQWADLQGASIFYSRYSPESKQTVALDYEQMRLTELARIDLIKRSQAPEEDIIQTILGELENPMLDILGGHILLLDKEPNIELLRKIIAKLRQLIGRHPDVEALALASGLDSEEGSYIFKDPPMLRRSWSLILKATIHKPDLVPLNSLASRVSQCVWGHSPWLIWMGQTEPHAAAPMKSAYSIEALSEEDLSIMDKKAPELSEIEKTLAKQLELTGYAKKGTDMQNPQLDDETIGRIVSIMGLPRADLEDMVNKLWYKLQPHE